MRYIRDTVKRIYKAVSFRGGGSNPTDQYYANNSVNRRKGIAGLKKTAGKVDKEEVKEKVNPKVLLVKSKLMSLRSGESLEVYGKGGKIYEVKMNEKQNALTLYVKEEDSAKPRRVRELSLKSKK